MTEHGTTSVQDALEPTIWYFAYGSNMRSSVMAKRSLKPLATERFVVPTHELTFDVFGVPYSEPAMASIKIRSTCAKYRHAVHGVAYRLSKTDYTQLVVSEGAGVAYDEIEVNGYLIGSKDKLAARTLVATLAPGKSLAPPTF